MPHDFIRFPELTNSQLELYQFSSPHKQITEDFTADVIRVHDGDTITVRWKERNFDFPIRLIGIDAPELNTEDGPASRDWLKQRIEGKTVDVKIEPSRRVGKFGRILGDIIQGGASVNEDSIRAGKAVRFEDRRESDLPSLKEMFDLKQWF